MTMKSLIAMNNGNENVLTISNNLKTNGNEIASIDLMVNPYCKIVDTLEKKLRNLEKRRTKLQQVKTDFENGTKLSEEQLEAISKTGEVESQIEYFKDTIKLVAQQQKQYMRDKKKYFDTLEKTTRSEEIKSIKCIIKYQEVLKFFGTNDFKKKLMQDSKLNFNVNILDSLQKVYEETTIFLDQCKNIEDWEEQTESIAKILKQIDFEHRDIVAGGLTGFYLKELLLKIFESEIFKNLRFCTNLKNENTVVFYNQTNDLNKPLQENLNISNNTQNNVNATAIDNKLENDLEKSLNVVGDKTLVNNLAVEQKVVCNNKEIAINENYSDDQAQNSENQHYENTIKSSEIAKPLKSVENEINNDETCEKISNQVDINEQNRLNNRKNFRRNNYRQKNNTNYRFQQNDNSNFRNNRLNGNIQQPGDRSNRVFFRRNEENNEKSFLNNGSVDKNRHGNSSDDKNNFRNNFRRSYRSQNNANFRRETQFYNNSSENTNNNTFLEESQNKDFKNHRNLQQRNAMGGALHSEEKKNRYKRSNECGFIFAH